VRICDECNFGALEGRCVICGGPGSADAYYCRECTIQEKDVSSALFVGLLSCCCFSGWSLFFCAVASAPSFILRSHVRQISPPLPPSNKQTQKTKRQRDGCVRVINLSAAQKDLFYERKRYGKKGG